MCILRSLPIDIVFINATFATAWPALACVPVSEVEMLPITAAHAPAHTLLSEHGAWTAAVQRSAQL